MGPTSIVRHIIQARNSTIWIAAFEGILRYDGKAYTNYTAHLTDHHFFNVIQDRNGNFWFTSIGAGVYFFDGSTFKNYTTADGLGSNRVPEVFEDRDGTVWFGTEGGVTRFDGMTFRNFTTADGLPNNDVSTITQDGAGQLWFGSRGGAAVCNGKTFWHFTRPAGAEERSFGNVRAIIEDGAGNMWLGGEQGLWQYDGSAFTHYDHRFVGYLYEDRAGNIWASTERGGGGWALLRYGARRLANPIQPPVERARDDFMIFGILEDGAGTVWYGSDRVNRLPGEG